MRMLIVLDGKAQMLTAEVISLWNVLLRISHEIMDLENTPTFVTAYHYVTERKR